MRERDVQPGAEPAAWRSGRCAIFRAEVTALDGRAAVQVSLRGELDLAEIAAARRAVAGAEQSNRHVVLDLRALEFIDLRGIEVVHGAIDRMGERLTILWDQGPIRRTFELVDSLQPARPACAAPASMPAAS